MSQFQDFFQNFSTLSNSRPSGTAVVYTAFDVARKGIVAVKEMKLERLVRKDLVLEEIKMMTKLKHKNIVNYLECFLLEKERKWVSMFCRKTMVVMMTMMIAGCG